jgi:hypothetical protein
MKSKSILLLLVIVFIIGKTSVMAQEFTINGADQSAQVGKFTFKLIDVILQESDLGSGMQLSMQLIDDKGIVDEFKMGIPESSNIGIVQSKFGLIIFKGEEGLDRYYYNEPEKIVWSFEFFPDTEDKTETYLYFIDSKLVTKDAYQELLKTLKGQENWYCDETEDGGETGWEALDTLKNRYSIVEQVDSKLNISSIKQSTK